MVSPEPRQLSLKRLDAHIRVDAVSALAAPLAFQPSHSNPAGTLMRRS
jgi:hypothetical protein